MTVAGLDNEDVLLCHGESNILNLKDISNLAFNFISLILCVTALVLHPSLIRILVPYIFLRSYLRHRTFVDVQKEVETSLYAQTNLCSWFILEASSCYCVVALSFAYFSFLLDSEFLGMVNSILNISREHGAPN